MKYLNPHYLFLGTSGGLLLVAVLRRRWCRPAAAARR